MRYRWLFLALMLGGLVYIEGCGPAPCDPAAMGAPGNLWPANYVIVSTSPTLTWEYPSTVPVPYPYPAGSTDCGISGYQVRLISSSGDDVDLGGMVSGSTTTSFSPAALAPATLYFWEARAVSFAGKGPWSGYRAFYTGPICATSALAAPTAYYPIGTIATLWPTMYWSYPGSSCLPEGYRIDLSTDPGFSDTSLSGGTGNPSTSWAPAHALQDCTTYFWRVAAINDTTLGPFSSTLSFETKVGLCLTAQVFIPRIYANCRTGPNTLFSRVSAVNPGEQLSVQGRHQTEDGTWFDVLLADGRECWISDVTGEFQGDIELVKFIVPPDLPKRKEPGSESSASCGDISDPKACDATPGCAWSRGMGCVGN
jgi:hypothetical protein